MVKQQGTCSVCNRINVSIYVMPFYNNRVCSTCYKKVRWKIGDERKRKLIKLKKDNEIKLTVWY